jgi:hypothetical protein
VVRAEVRDEADIAPFDAWYEKHHLPDARKAFNATRAWRCWSLVEPRVHHAYYEFPSEEAALAIRDRSAMQMLIAEFDETWGDRVHRTRDILKVIGRI